MAKFIADHSAPLKAMVVLTGLRQQELFGFRCIGAGEPLFVTYHRGTLSTFHDGYYIAVSMNQEEFFKAANAEGLELTGTGLKTEAEKTFSSMLKILRTICSHIVYL